MFQKLLILSLFSSGFSYAQKDTINRQDGNMCRQGYWRQSQPGDKAAISEEGRYVDGRKEGLWTEYFLNGKKKNEISFVNGRAKGPYNSYYESGGLREKGTWNKNRLTGDYYMYYESGQLQQQFFFSESGHRQGTQCYYDENGKLTAEDIKTAGPVKQYSLNKASPNKTKTISYYDKKKIKYLDRSFTNGVADSAFTYYYENGQPQLTGSYKNGHMSGLRMYYDSLGKAITGNFTMLNHLTGVKEREGRAIDGKPEGEVRIFDFKGDLIMIANFSHGFPEGSTYHYSKGAITKIDFYSLGEFVMEMKPEK